MEKLDFEIKEWVLEEKKISHEITIDYDGIFDRWFDGNGNKINPEDMKQGRTEG